MSAMSSPFGRAQHALLSVEELREREHTKTMQQQQRVGLQMQLQERKKELGFNPTRTGSGHASPNARLHELDDNHAKRHAKSVQQQQKEMLLEQMREKDQQRERAKEQKRREQAQEREELGLANNTSQYAERFVEEHDASGAQAARQPKSEALAHGSQEMPVAETARLHSSRHRGRQYVEVDSTEEERCDTDAYRSPPRRSHGSPGRRHSKSRTPERGRRRGGRTRSAEVYPSDEDGHAEKYVVVRVQQQEETFPDGGLQPEPMPASISSKRPPGSPSSRLNEFGDDSATVRSRGSLLQQQHRQYLLGQMQENELRRQREKEEKLRQQAHERGELGLPQMPERATKVPQHNALDTSTGDSHNQARDDRTRSNRRHEEYDDDTDRGDSRRRPPPRDRRQRWDGRRDDRRRDEWRDGANYWQDEMYDRERDLFYDGHGDGPYRYRVADMPDHYADHERMMHPQRSNSSQPYVGGRRGGSPARSCSVPSSEFAGHRELDGRRWDDPGPGTPQRNHSTPAAEPVPHHAVPRHASPGRSTSPARSSSLDGTLTVPGSPWRTRSAPSEQQLEYAAELKRQMSEQQRRKDEQLDEERRLRQRDMPVHSKEGVTAGPEGAKASSEMPPRRSVSMPAEEDIYKPPPGLSVTGRKAWIRRQRRAKTPSKPPTTTVSTPATDSDLRDAFPASRTVDERVSAQQSVRPGAPASSPVPRPTKSSPLTLNEQPPGSVGGQAEPPALDLLKEGMLKHQWEVLKEQQAFQQQQLETFQQKQQQQQQQQAKQQVDLLEEQNYLREQQELFQREVQLRQQEHETDKQLWQQEQAATQKLLEQQQQSLKQQQEQQEEQQTDQKSLLLQHQQALEEQHEEQQKSSSADDRLRRQRQNEEKWWQKRQRQRESEEQRWAEQQQEREKENATWLQLAAAKAARQAEAGKQARERLAALKKAEQLLEQRIAARKQEEHAWAKRIVARKQEEQQWQQRQAERSGAEERRIQVHTRPTQERSKRAQVNRTRDSPTAHGTAPKDTRTHFDALSRKVLTHLLLLASKCGTSVAQAQDLVLLCHKQW